MKAVEYMGRVLLDGRLEIPATARHELALRPNVQVKVILMREEQRAEEQTTIAAEQARKRHEAWQAVMKLRQSFAGMDFSLTDEIVRMRGEEDG
jgi:hypothetical protein